MAKYLIEKYFEFIEKHTPHFEKSIEGKYAMFSVPTQHIEGYSVEELLNAGIEADEKQDGKSPLRHLVDKLDKTSGIPEHLLDNRTDYDKLYKYLDDWHEKVFGIPHNCLDSYTIKDNEATCNICGRCIGGKGSDFRDKPSK